MLGAVARLHVGVWSFVVVAAVQTFNLVDRGMPWRGEWNWAVDWAGSGLIILGPLLAGIAAVDGGRLGNERRLPQTHTLPGPLRAVWGLWLTATVASSTAHLASLGVFLVLADSATAVPRGPSLLLVVAQLAALSAYILLGSVLGRLLGAVLGAPISVVGAVWVYWELGRSSETFSAFNVGAATSSLLGLQFSIRHLLLQLAYLAGFVAVCFLVHAVTKPRLRVATVSAAFLMVAALNTVPNELPRLEGHPVSPSRCMADQVTVCVYPDHQRFLAGLSRDAARVRAAADRAGIGDLLPAIYVERVPGEGVRPADDQRGRLEIMPDHFESGEVPTANVIYSMVLPWHCPNLYGDSPPPPAFSAAVDGIADMLTTLVDSDQNAPPTVRNEARARMSMINACGS
ncbi:hypothetical protein ABT214_13415 [Micromonospora purpureochromogenes]|uniref:hypothetical protein n=1 Tax=Micromonospora purpureochromogenes TaxID=47872 RepID=UPI00332BDF6D